MSPVFEETIKRDIKSGDLAPVYILFGDDSYLKKHYSDSIIKSVCGDDTDFNLQIFDESADLQNVYDAVNQFPMMAQKKCVCLYDYDFERADKSDFDRLCEILTDVPDTTVFVLRFDSVEFDVKRNSKVKKLLSSAEKSGGKAVRLDHRSTPELVRMLVRGAQKRGSVLSEKAAKYLIEISGGDINTLTAELEKLCLFSSGEEITEETVNFVCTKSVDASVYDYVKEIFASNITNALSLLDSMFFMHIEPMIILYTTASSYIDIYRVYAAGQSGISLSEVSEHFGYKGKDFLLERASKNLRKFTHKKLKASFDEILKADKTLKSFSSDERTVLEELTVKLVLIMASDGDSF